MVYRLVHLNFKDEKYYVRLVDLFHQVSTPCHILPFKYQCFNCAAIASRGLSLLTINVVASIKIEFLSECRSEVYSCSTLHAVLQIVR